MVVIRAAVSFKAVAPVEAALVIIPSFTYGELSIWKIKFPAEHPTHTLDWLAFHHVSEGGHVSISFEECIVCGGQRACPCCSILDKLSAWVILPRTMRTAAFLLVSCQMLAIPYHPFYFQRFDSEIVLWLCMDVWTVMDYDASGSHREMKKVRELLMPAHFS